jgi:hypothetical protein
VVVQHHKQRLRQRLVDMAKEMGARSPHALADGLLLLIEGVYVSAQEFGPDGPAKNVASAAEQLIEASVR